MHSLRSRFRGQVVWFLCLLVALTSLRLTPIRAAASIRFWHSWTGDALIVLQTWVKDYQAASSDKASITLEFVPFFDMQSRLAAAPADQRPDAFIGPSDWTGALIANRQLLQLDAQLDDGFRARFSDKVWKLAQYDNRVIALPVSIEGLALFYNRAEIDEKALPATWDDLLKQGSRGVILSKDFYTTASLFFAQNGQLTTPTGDSLLGQGNAYKAYLNALKDLWARSKQGELLVDAPADAFRRGNAGFILVPNTFYPEFKRSLGDKVGVAPLPKINGNPWQAFIRAQQLFVALGSSQVEILVDFGKFITSTLEQSAAAKLAGFVPTNAEALSGDPLVAVMGGSLLKDGVPILNRVEMSAYWPAIGDAVRAVTFRGGDIDIAMRTSLETINKSIKKLRGQ